MAGTDGACKLVIDPQGHLVYGWRSFRGIHTSQQVQLVNAAMLCPAGEGILEDVQLRVEAFEYLQLPFAIKEGSVGRLKLQVCAIPTSCAEALLCWQ
jgi:hypothetical protein